MTIHIEVENEYLVVSNLVAPKKRKGASFGIGLENPANRCRLMTDKEIFVPKRNLVFIVKIPIIQ